MWLKGVLMGKGHQVWLPQLPDSNKPNTEKYTKFLLSNKDFILDENTTLIGHSSGAVEILHLIQHLPKDTSIKDAVLVSAFKDDLNWDNLSELFLEPLDFEMIQAACPKFTFIHSDNDPYVPLEHAQYLAEKTDGDLIVFPEQGHFNTEADARYKQFPEILDFIEY
jgi:predicted alpha/beta hydrolase family esterase